MAVLNLSVTLADADFARLMTAARSVFPTPVDAQGNPRQLTDAEIVEGIRQHGIGLMRQLVRNYERAAAIKAAEALDPQIEVA